MKKADFRKFAPTVKLLAHGLIFFLIIFRVGFLLVRRQAIKLFLKRQLPGDNRRCLPDGEFGSGGGRPTARSAGEPPSPTELSR
jgi:hypothetical protein